MGYCGIITKAIAKELSTLNYGRIDKIVQSSKNDLQIGIYANNQNYTLHISTDSSFYRVCLTKYLQDSPKIPTNFCMVLRKHLLGLRLNSIYTTNLERIITFEFTGFDDVDDVINKKLIVELMGKHCNIILLEDNGYIIESLRHIVSDVRNIVPHKKYILPTSDKINFLDIKNLNFNISSDFVGISKSHINYLFNTNNKNSDLTYNTLLNTVHSIDSFNYSLIHFKLPNSQKEDFCLINNSNKKEILATTNLTLNFEIDEIYYTKETKSQFTNFSNKLKSLVNTTYSKLSKRLRNIDQKLFECSNMDMYRLYGELITANLYKLPNYNVESVEVENYYDNNNLLTISLDKKYLPSINAKKFYKKYNKLNNTLKIVSIQKKETLEELKYLESILYEIDSSKTISEFKEIEQEILTNNLFKTTCPKHKLDSIKHSKRNNKNSKQDTNNKSFNPRKYIINGYTFLVGRNNHENDYLTLKYAKKTDIWFHTKDLHGSHCILCLDNKPSPDFDTISKSCSIAAYFSKGVNSSNVPVDYCFTKFVKKPNSSRPGMVIYTNNKTLIVNPSLTIN